MALIIENGNNIVWLKKEEISCLYLWFNMRNEARIHVITKGAKDVIELGEVNKNVINTKIKEWLTNSSSNDIVIEV